MTSQVLLAALAKKHSDAVFVAECKNGPTQTGSHRRLDAWVLLKTWSPVTTIGYEIKVDRADWRRDEKIAEYMGLCHSLFIVAPKGVVPLEELPEGVGLIEAVGDQARLVTRRKAPRREIEMPVSLMIYVLMCRATVNAEQKSGGQRGWRLEGLRQWAESKDERQRLHYSLSRKIQRVFDAQQEEVDRVKRRIQELEHVERRILELGFDPRAAVQSWQVEKRLSAITRVIDPWLLKQMEQLEHEISGVRQSLTALKQPQSVDAVDPAGELLTG